MENIRIITFGTRALIDPTDKQILESMCLTPSCHDHVSKWYREDITITIVEVSTSCRTPTRTRVNAAYLPFPVS
jgi:hypothetical protein